MKKIFALFLTLLINFMMISPCLAYEYYYPPLKADEQPQQEEQNTTLITSIEEEKVYLDPKSVYQLELEADLDINETPDNDEIYFRLKLPVKLSNGKYLPEHTRFAGKFKKVIKSKPLFKRARAYILIDKILMPNGNTYEVRMEPKSGSDLKSSQGLNVLRAIPASIGITTISVISAITVVVESVSIVGLVIVPRTCKGFGLFISSMAKGLNYKAKAGSVLEFKLDTPAYINISDLK